MSATVKLTQITPGMSLVRPPDPPGALQTYVTVVDGDKPGDPPMVVLDFGVALSWAKFRPEEAEKLATELLGAVRQARTIHLPAGD